MEGLHSLLNQTQHESYILLRQYFNLSICNLYQEILTHAVLTLFGATIELFNDLYILVALLSEPLNKSSQSGGHQFSPENIEVIM